MSIVRKGRAEKWLEMREKSGIEQWKKAFGVKERAFGVKKSGDRWRLSRGGCHAENEVLMVAIATIPGRNFFLLW